MLLQVSEVVESIHSIAMFSKCCGKNQKALQSIETSPANESGTRPITQMDSVTRNSSFSAAQEALYQRHVEEGCDLFIDLDYVRWLHLYHP